MILSPTIHRVGTRALLIDLADLDQVMSWHASLTSQPLRGQRSVIAAAQTVLLEFDSPRDTQSAVRALSSYQPTAPGAADTREVTIDVHYDGEDLDNAARLLEVSTEELIRRHTSQRWMAAFGGFAPGFTYCVPSDANPFQWNIPRHDSPRTAVPAGAVALAGDFSAVYPRQSPGGWQLIGHTDTLMWDASADQPALLNPGDTVIYRAVRENINVQKSDSEEQKPTDPARRPVVPGRPVVRMDKPGLQSLFQDLGRPGHGDIGVNSSGAVDRASARAANAAVGNSRHAVVIENIGGFTITALIDTAVAVTGADTTVTVTNRDGIASRHDLASPIALLAGDTLTVDAPTIGARNYLAIRGGCAAPEVLESAASDVLSGLGPDAVTAGEQVKSAGRTVSAVNTAITNPLRVSGDGATTVRCVLGPRADWFSEATVQRFLDTIWDVSGQSNRIGLRLNAPGEDGGLERDQDGELASEGMVGGSIQVPPNGMPVVFLADHPVTGGYPVIATVIPEDLDIAGQLPPGSTIRFVAVDPDHPSSTTTPQKES